MAHYIDSHGNTRHFEVLLTTVAKVKNALGIDLFSMSDLEQVSGHPLAFAKLMQFTQVLHSQPAESENDWCRAHVGDALERAVDAFMEALCDFFPSRLAAPLRVMTRAASLVTLDDTASDLPDCSEFTPEN